MSAVDCTIAARPHARRWLSRGSMEDVNDNEHGWVAYLPGTKNEHLLPAARDRVTRAHDEVQHRRGRLVARVVVEVYENREAVPQVQFPSEPPDEADRNDRVRQAADAVRQAVVALTDWR
jgi:hypothetical protein